MGQPSSAREALTAIISRRELGWMAFVTIFIFIVWMYLARFLVALFLGLHASFSTLQQFITVVLTTSDSRSGNETTISRGRRVQGLRRSAECHHHWLQSTKF
jgi:uncharacterized membrane protein